MKTHARRGEAGFSFVELLVTIIIAGIAFAALVPLFVQAQQKTSADQVRNVALNIAQEKIELIRQSDWTEIASYDDTWTSDSGRTFTVRCVVTDVADPSGSGQTAYKDVTVTVRWTAPPKPVKPVQLQTRVYRQSAGARVTKLVASPTSALFPGDILYDQLKLTEYISGQVTLTATTASPADFVTFFVYNGDGSLVAPAAQDIYHKGGTTFTCTWTPSTGLDGLYYVSAVATAGGYPGNTLQTSYYVETGAPLPPTGLLPQVGEEKVILRWTRPGANDVSHYKIYRSDGAAPEKLVVLPDGALTTAEVFTDAGLHNGTTYTYRVTAVDILGNESAKSSAVTATPNTPGDGNDPTPPGSLSATIAGPSVVLSWTSSSDDVAVLGYLVYRDENLLSPIGRVDAGATSFIDSSAGYSQTHTYTVKAYDTSLNESGLATLISPLPPGTANADGWLQVGTGEQVLCNLLVSTNKSNVTMAAVSQDSGKLYSPSVNGGANKPFQFTNLPAGTYSVTGTYVGKSGEQRVTIVVHLTTTNQAETINFQ